MTKTNVQPIPSNSQHHDTPNNKTHVIKFRVTAEEKASLELTCKLLNLSLSTFIRRAIHNVKIEKTVIVASGGEETLTAVSTLLATTMRPFCPPFEIFRLEKNAMLTLEWIGKNKVVNHHQEVPFRVLERQYSFGEQGQHTENNDSENMIIHGDNLEALKALLPQYEGKVKCIYIDPPYNTGNEGWCYNDNVSDPHIQKWLGEVVGKEGEDLTRHDKWLCMMYPRLMLLQKLLADDGVIFISIDDNELYRFDEFLKILGKL